MTESLDLIEPGVSARPSPSAIRAELTAPPVMAMRPKSWLARLWQRGRHPLQGRREPCVVVAVLMILDRGLALDGLVTAASPTTLTFRQASTFIFDRTGAEVSIRYGDLDRRGRIVEVSPHGYGVRLTEPMDEAEFEAFMAEYGQTH